MKTDKPANPNKLLRKEIELRLIAQLTTLTSPLGKGSKKLKKEIEKGAKKLSKKLSKEITPVKATEAPVAPIAKKAPATKRKPAVKAAVAVKPVKAVKAETK